MGFSTINNRGLVRVLAIGLAVLFMSAQHADARRAAGGGFGSRGTRTFQAAPTTNVAPTPAIPIQRSMTPRQAPQAAPVQPQGAAPRPGFFRNFGGSLLGGLLLGGLIGAVLGTGFGGVAGLLGMLLQIVLVVAVIGLVMRFIRARRQQQASVAGSPLGQTSVNGSAGFASPLSRTQERAAASGASRQTDEIGINQNDLNTFERLLGEIQSAYGREDYPALRRDTTPEAMSYLAEELADLATRGMRNSVSGVHLLRGDVSEAWREGDTDYATLAMRYASIDATLDRATGRVLEGDATIPSETTEVWTFARRVGTDWKLSAIQAT